MRVFDPDRDDRARRARTGRRSPRAATGRARAGRPTGSPRRRSLAPRSLQDADFWAQAGARFLAPLLLAAALSDRDDGRRRCAGSTPRSTTRSSTRSTPPEHEPAAQRAAHRLERRRPPALVALPDGEPRARRLQRPDGRSPAPSAPSSPPTGCSTAAPTPRYLCAPADEQARLRPLFVTLIREIVGEVYARAAPHRPADRSGRCSSSSTRRANIAPLPDLDQIASTGAGQGLQLVTVFQDLAQVHQRWGAKADTIVNNHRAKLFGPGISCARTLDYVRRILGDAELTSALGDVGRARPPLDHALATFRPLAPPNALRERRERFDAARLRQPAAGDRPDAALVPRPRTATRSPEARDERAPDPAAAGRRARALRALRRAAATRDAAWRSDTTPEIVDDACAFAWMKLRRATSRGARPCSRGCGPSRGTRRSSSHRLSRRSCSASTPTSTRRDARLPRRAAGRTTAQGLLELRERLAQLPPRQREMVFLHAAGWRYDEIAEHLGRQQTPGQPAARRRPASSMREMDMRELEPNVAAGAPASRAIEDEPPQYIVASIGRQPTRRTASTGSEAATARVEAARARDRGLPAGERRSPIVCCRSAATGTSPRADAHDRRIAGYRRDRGLVASESSYEGVNVMPRGATGGVELITYGGEIVATAGARRFYLAPRIRRAGRRRPARDVRLVHGGLRAAGPRRSRRSGPTPTSARSASRASCSIDDDEFRMLDANELEDRVIAGHFGVPVEQVEEKRQDVHDFGS